MPDSSFHFGGLVSEFVHSIQTPGEPVTPQGQIVSSFVHENHIPGNPVSPGDLVSEFVHAAIQGSPILPLGHEVSPFVDGLHDGVSTFSTDALGWML